MSLTTSQYRSLELAQQTLVERGWHPAVAGRLVRRAADRLLSSGLGCSGSGNCCGSCANGLGIQQLRYVPRDQDASIAPRPRISGEQCIRIQETPGAEEHMWTQLQEYQNRGWTISQVENTKGFPSLQVYWACPPGAMPRESQTQMLQSRPYGVPLYVREF